MIKLKDILTELSAIDKYYKNNPEKLINFDGELSFDSVTQDIIDYIVASGEIEASDGYTDTLKQLEKKLSSKYDSKIKIRYGNTRDIIYTVYRHSKTAFKSNDNSISFILNNWKNITDEVAKAYKSYSDAESYEENSKVIDELLNDKDLKEYVRLSILKTYRVEMAIQKMATRAGMTLGAFLKAVEEIKRLQSKSYQRMSAAHKKVIKALTVDKNNLPKTIWRGFFFDGAKIKNKTTFLKKWAEGNKPKVAFTKETSWSKSKQTAIEFMMDQDRVKGREDGFHILIRYDNPTYEDIAADLSNFTLSQFYNQREVMLNTSAKEYTVEKVIPYEKWEKDKESEYSKYRSTNDGEFGSGTWGLRKVDLIGNVFRANKANLKQSEKVEVVNIINKQLKDVSRKYTSNFSEYLLDVAKEAKFPLVLFTVRELDLGYKLGKIAGVKYGSATVEDREFSEDTSRTTYKLPSDGETIKKILSPLNSLISQESPEQKSLVPEDFEIKVTVTQTQASFYKFAFNVNVDEVLSYTGENDSKYVKEAIESLSTFVIPKIKEYLNTEFKSDMKKINVNVTITS